VASSDKAVALSLWDTTNRASDLSNGAQIFKSTILNTYQGRDESVISVTSAFDKWMESVLEVKSIVKSMKEARWDDTFADDVDDEPDDELGDSKQALLSDDDPKLLEEATQEALSEAMQNLSRSFNAIVKKSDGEQSTQKATFMLRVVREIGDRIPQLRLQDKATPLTSPFTSDILQPLHNALALCVTQPTVEAYKVSLSDPNKVKTSSHILWEGHPPLPSQPSPSAFRFLRELNKNMGALGSDLWAPGSVYVLKSGVADEVVKTVQEHLDAMDTHTKESSPPADNTDEGKEEDEESATTDEMKKPELTISTSNDIEAKEQRVQQLIFDLLYIQRFVGNAGEDDDKFASLVKKADMAGLDEVALNRLKKNAADYAKKTYLLFALLA
jgi:hypothetical protein